MREFVNSIAITTTIYLNKLRNKNKIIKQQQQNSVKDYLYIYVHTNIYVYTYVRVYI